MITCMLSGTLTKSPEQRTSKNGNTYSLASIRIPSAEGDLFASVTAFEPLAATLAGMAKGDPITVVGTAKLSAYQAKDGEHRAGLSIIASRIIGIADHQAPPKPKADGQGRRTPASAARPDPREFGADEFTDRVPF